MVKTSSETNGEGEGKSERRAFFSPMRLLLLIYNLTRIIDNLKLSFTQFLTYTKRSQLQSRTTFAHMNNSSNSSVNISMSGSGRDGHLGGDIFRGRGDRSAMTTFEAHDTANEVHSTSAAEKMRDEDEDLQRMFEAFECMFAEMTKTNERMIAEVTKTKEQLGRMIAKMEVEEAEREALEKFCEQQKRKKDEEAAQAA